MDVTLPGIAVPLRWHREPVEYAVDGSDLTVTAAPRTDLFADPDGSTPNLTAPRLLTRIDGDLTLAARVGVEFAEVFDAGALVVWADERRWAKLCLEYSPQRVPTVVSVVTRDRSDDANAVEVPARATWLRVARRGDTYAFHASADGERWELIRYFWLGDGTSDAELGLEAQSPLGDGCTARFAAVACRQETLADIRDGS